MNDMNKAAIAAAIQEEIRAVKPSLTHDLETTDHLVDDCGFESLDMVELVARIEARFRIPIDDQQYRLLSSIDTITGYLLQQDLAVAS